MTNKEFTTIRKNLKMTQTEIGKTIGKSLRQIQYYENGKIEIPTHVVKFLELLEKDTNNVAQKSN